MLDRSNLEYLTRPRMKYLEFQYLDFMEPKARRKFEIMLVLVGPLYDCRVLSDASLWWINRLYANPSATNL